MENNLRKHVLSNYASINRTNISTGPTAVTENIENSDVDEFVMSGPTHITRSIEESDPDGSRSVRHGCFSLTPTEGRIRD